MCKTNDNRQQHVAVADRGGYTIPLPSVYHRAVSPVEFSSVGAMATPATTSQSTTVDAFNDRSPNASPAQSLATEVCERDKLSAAVSCTLFVCESTCARPAQLGLWDEGKSSPHTSGAEMKIPHHVRARRLQHVHPASISPHRSAVRQRLFVLITYVYYD